MPERNYRTEAQEQIPAGYFVLTDGDDLRADDLVYSWTTREFIRADSPDWIIPCLKIKIEDLICAVRRDFSSEVPSRRSYTIKTMKAEMKTEVKHVISDNEILRILCPTNAFAEMIKNRRCRTAPTVISLCRRMREKLSGENSAKATSRRFVNRSTFWKGRKPLKLSSRNKNLYFEEN